MPTVKLILLALVLTYVATIPTIIYSIFHPEVKLGGPGWGKDDVVKMLSRRSSTSKTGVQDAY